VSVSNSPPSSPRARVVLLGRNAERGADACEAVCVRARRAGTGFVRVDGSIATDAVRAESECRTLLDSLDVLVCATGPSEPPQLLPDIPVQDFAGRLDELILPPLHMIQAALPAMRAQGGGAIVVASDAARIPTPGESLIGPAMAAIVMFVKTTALEAKRSFSSSSTTGDAHPLQEMNLDLFVLEQLVQQLRAAHSQPAYELLARRARPEHGRHALVRRRRLEQG
jgi:NAD(P)-dependent dehydrogenase (short-subunit alcohol dehydrogenase family)